MTAVIFSGIEIWITYKSQSDGVVALDFVCKDSRPVIYTKAPYARIHDISTLLELKPGEASVLESAKQERIETHATGVVALPGLSKTDHVHTIQTFVIVTLEPPHNVARARDESE